VRVDIEDTGIGIPTEKLERVFESFQQADTSTSRSYGGPGLGLPISRSLCRMMGFDLAARSMEGVGSLFTVIFASDAPEPAWHSEPESTSEELSEHNSDRMVVLVIDDEEDSRAVLSEYISEHGCEVITAASGREGLDSMRQVLGR
jgi:hypothetical protein